MSTPSRSARLASSFMNEMRTASMQLAAYLVNSAERTSMNTPVVVAVERRVHLAAASRARCRCVLHADHDAVGPHEVLDREAFLQELRVGRDVPRRRARRAASSSSRSASRTLSFVPTGTVGLDDHQRVALQPPPQFAGRGQHVRKVRRAVFVRRRAHGDEDDVGVLDRLVVARGELQPARLAAHDHGVEAGLVDGNLAAAQAIDLAGSTSTHRTWLPTSARHAPVTRPT